MFEQQQPLTEILLDVTLEDDLAFTVEFVEQREQQVLRVLYAGVIRLSADDCPLVGLPLDGASAVAGLDLAAGLANNYDRCCEMVYLDPPCD